MGEFDVGNGGFTTKEILIRLEAKVDHVLQDHEARVRKLESFRNKFPSIAVVTAMLYAGGVILAWFHP